MIKLPSLPLALAALALISGGLSRGADSDAPAAEAKSPAAPETAPADPAAALRKTIRAKLIALVADSALEIPPANIPEELSNRVKLAQLIDDAPGKSNGIPVVIRGSLELLTRFEPADDFSYRLWRAAAAIDYLQRATGSEEMTRLLDGMIDLCALLPKTDEANYQGEFLRATVLIRRKKPDAAGAILAELRDRTGLPDDFRRLVLSTLGDNDAVRHDYNAAISNWEAVDDFPENPVSVQPLLSAVFAHLERGERDGAYHVLGMLRPYKPEVIKASPAGAQAAELLALSHDRAESDAFWDGQAKWWPAWLEVDRRLGAPPPPEHVEIPLIPSIPQLGAMIGRAAQQSDAPERARGIRMLAHAARWEPSMLVELVELLGSLGPLQLNNLAGDYRAFVIAAYEQGNVKDPLKRRPLCCMAASAYIDSQQNEKGQAAIREFQTLPQADDAVSQIASRLSAVAALNTGKGIEEAAAEGEKALDSSAYEFFRAQGANLLSLLYERMGQNKEALALLDREMKQPAIQKDPAALRLLKYRRQALQSETSPKQKLSGAAKAWLDKIQLPWLDFSRPHALSDPGVADLDQALMLGTATVNPCEQTKIASLIVLDDSQPEKRKLSALWILGFYSCAFAPDADTASRWARSFLDTPNLPAGAREAFLAGSTLRAFAEDDARLFQSLASSPARATLNEPASSLIEQSERYFAACKAGNDECVRLAFALLGKPFTGASRDVFQHIVFRLIASGDFEKAKGLITALGVLPQSLDSENAKAAIQLALMKGLAREQKWRPVNEAIRDVVLARFGKDEPAPSAEPPTSDYRILALNLPAEEANVVRLQLMRHGRFTAQPDAFWGQFLRDLPRNAKNFALRSASLRSGLGSAGDDGTRADVARMLATVFDIDSADERRVADEILKPLRELDRESKTSDAVREFDFAVALRIGSAFDVKGALAGIKEDTARRTADITTLNHAVADGNETLLRFLVDSISPQELLSDRMLAASLSAWRLLGMKDEVVLAEQTGREAAYRLMIEFWMGGNDGAALNAYQIAEMLGDDALIPRVMSERLIASRRHELTKLTLDGEDAVFRGAWDRTLNVCEQALREFPTYYHFLFQQGKAFAALNRPEDALRSLRSYTSVVHDEMDVHAAKELIKKLSISEGKTEGAPK